MDTMSCQYSSFSAFATRKEVPYDYERKFIMLCSPCDCQTFKLSSTPIFIYVYIVTVTKGEVTAAACVSYPVGMFPTRLIPNCLWKLKPEETSVPTTITSNSIGTGTRLRLLTHG